MPLHPSLHLIRSDSVNKRSGPQWRRQIFWRCKQLTIYTYILAPLDIGVQVFLELYLYDNRLCFAPCWIKKSFCQKVSNINWCFCKLLTVFMSFVIFLHEFFQLFCEMGVLKRSIIISPDLIHSQHEKWLSTLLNSIICIALGHFLTFFLYAIEFIYFLTFLLFFFWIGNVFYLNWK